MTPRVPPIQRRAGSSNPLEETYSASLLAEKSAEGMDLTDERSAEDMLVSKTTEDLLANKTMEDFLADKTAGDLLAKKTVEDLLAEKTMEDLLVDKGAEDLLIASVYHITTSDEESNTRELAGGLVMHTEGETSSQSSQDQNSVFSEERLPCVGQAVEVGDAEDYVWQSQRESVSFHQNENGSKAALSEGMGGTETKFTVVEDGADTDGVLFDKLLHTIKGFTDNFSLDLKPI